jgi:hypothetical protein
MKCILKIPHTENWDSFPDLQTFLDHVPSRIVGHDPAKVEFFLSNVRRWSDLYDCLFTAYRHKLKQISLKNWDRLPCEQTHIQPWELSREDAFLLMDDDDWFNPAVVEEVERAFTDRPDIDVVYWDAWQYKTVNGTEEYYCHSKRPFGSNSFAIRGGFDQQFYMSGAHARIDDLWDKSRMLGLPNRCLSLWNIHPGSLFLRSRVELPDNINELQRVDRPAIFDWAVEEIDALYTLITSIRRI